MELKVKGRWNWDYYICGENVAESQKKKWFGQKSTENSY